MIADDIRILETHIQTRHLRILGVLMRGIGRNNEIPYFILESAMEQWSQNEEKQNPDYQISQGKLTEKGHKTLAFKAYVRFAEKLQLIFIIGQTLQLTKFGEIFILLYPLESEREKSFYWYWLMQYDADTLLTLGQILVENPPQTPLKDATIRLLYKDALKKRLLTKIQQADTHTTFVIESMLRNQEMDTKKTPFAYKHLVSPRLAWFCELGILPKTKNYHLTDLGKAIWTQLPRLNGSEQRDISASWLNESCLQAYSGSQYPSFQHWKSLDIDAQKVLLGKSLSLFYEKAYQSKEGNRRMNGYSALIFSIFHLYSVYDILADRGDLEMVLKIPLFYHPYLFTYHRSDRHYESYISFTYNQN